MKQKGLVGLTGVLAIVTATFLTTAHTVTAPPPSVSQAQATQALAGLAVPFEENKGQTDARVAFLARTLAGPLFVTREGELVWSLNATDAASSSRKPQASPASAAVETAPAWSVVERFVGGGPNPRVMASLPLG